MAANTNARCALGVACVLLAVACGDDGRVAQLTGEDGGGLEVREPLTAPSVRLLSPPTWAAGDTVVVLGSDFVAPERGSVSLVLRGEFIEESGKRLTVDVEVPAKFRNAGRVEFVFEPALPPQGFGHEVGSFEGEVLAVNRDDVEEVASASVAARVDVGPSLIVWAARPSGAACAKPRVDSTLADEVIDIDLEAVGLAPATTYAPLAFRVSYTRLDGEPQVHEATLTGGRSARLEVAPGALPPGQVEASVLINASVEDGQGTTLSRTLSVDVGLPYFVRYDGNVRIAELYPAVQVSSCLPGGEFGRDVTYSGGQSESRSRSVSYSVNLGLDLWVVNVGFGLSVSESVSSDQSESLSISGRVLPGQYGVFYRQTQRLVRLGRIMRRDECGALFQIGEARVTDWSWAPDLALTSNGQCPPAPPTNLPPAQVFP